MEIFLATFTSTKLGGCRNAQVHSNALWAEVICFPIGDRYVIRPVLMRYVFTVDLAKMMDIDSLY